jgi:hypothetical protein
LTSGPRSPAPQRNKDRNWTRNRPILLFKIRYAIQSLLGAMIR